jgi:multicomponent Na+:H+ antiporter subunit E
MRRLIAYFAGMTTAWVLLWDQASIGNIAGGLLVSAALLVAFPLRPVPAGERLAIRPVALARLAVAVVSSLLRSNLLVSREIVSRGSSLHTGVVACPMLTDSPKLLATIANIIALSPGMMAVDATAAPPTLYVHVLQLDDVHLVRHRVAVLERQVIEAVGSRRSRAALEASTKGAVQ